MALACGDSKSKCPRPHEIVTNDPNLRALVLRAEVVARSDAAVLLIGETGVGKELFAEHIHRTSGRSERRFVGLALSAMPYELVESELFGHERGAFTTAHSEKPGLFEQAHHGTMFLDDVDDVPLAIQAKLLRVLETGKVQRVGAITPTSIDVRLIAASKVNLPALIESRLFRADLYYRINGCPLQIPPLRERVDDIPLLVNHFLQQFMSGDVPRLSTDATWALKSYEWPGNVRELRNLVQRIALFASDRITLADLPSELVENRAPQEVVKECLRCAATGGLRYSEIVQCLERQLLSQALARSQGNTSRAARALDLSHSTLRDKLRRLGISKDRRCH